MTSERRDSVLKFNDLKRRIEMKKTIRTIALIMSLIMLLGMFAACAVTNDGEESTSASVTPDPNDPSGTTEAEDTMYVPDDLDEKYDFDEVITVFMWSDFRMTEFYAEETGDIIDDAIYHRNNKVEGRLGITFDFIEEPGDSNAYKSWITVAENDWNADNDFDIYAGYSRTIPLMTIKKMTANLLEQDAFSVEKPWWPEALTSELTINDKLYMCTGDIATSLLWYMVAIMYNKDLYEATFQLDKTPMDMVEADEWTLDNFMSIVKDMYTDIDTNGAKDENDFYGATFFDTDLDSFQISAGITSLEKDAYGGLKLSDAWQSERCANICETVGESLKNDGVFCGDSGSSRVMFRMSQSVFHMDRVFIIPGADSSDSGGLEFACGVVPLPKFDADQTAYKTNVGNPFTIYAINAQSDAIEAAVTTLEAWASESYRSVTPAVFEVAMKVRYTDDPQVAGMFDILRENISFDAGKLYHYTMEKTTSNLFRDVLLSANPSGFLSKLQASRRILDSKLKDVMAAYDD